MLFQRFVRIAPIYKKVVLIEFLYKTDVDLLHDCGFLKNDTNSLCFEF